MDVQADAVAGAVDEILAVPGALYHAPRGGVHVAQPGAGLCGGDGGGVRLADDVVNSPELRVRLAEPEGACHVSPVAAEGPAEVHEEAAEPYPVPAGRMARVGGVLPRADAGPGLREAEGAHLIGERGEEFALRPAQPVPAAAHDALEGLVAEAAGRAQALALLCVLIDAQRVDYPPSAGEISAREARHQRQEEARLGRFVHRDARRRIAAAGELAREERIWVLPVAPEQLLPREELPRLELIEAVGEEEGLAPRREGEDE